MTDTNQESSDALEIAVAVVIKDILQESPKILIQKRSEDGELDGKWECPGGKIKAGETAEQAAARELFEEVGLQVEPSRGRWLGVYPYAYGDRKVKLYTVTFFYGQGDVEISHGVWQSLWLEKEQGGEKTIDPFFFERMPEGNHAFLQHLSYQLEDIVYMAQKDELQWKL